MGHSSGQSSTVQLTGSTKVQSKEGREEKEGIDTGK